MKSFFDQAVNHLERVDAVAVCVGSLLLKPAHRTSLAMHPLGKLGQPEDVASAMAWLMNPEQGWITGQVLGVDGGLATLTARPGRS